MNYEIQILKAETSQWNSLELFENKVRYNYGLGDIGDLQIRKVNHSNTYSIKNTGLNRNLLELNLFNSTKLAARLNKKYKFRIRRNYIIVREGYLIVGNIDEAEVKINLIDEAVDLTDKWGDILLRDFLTSEIHQSRMPSAYRNALDALKVYAIPPIQTPFVITSSISGKSYPITKFPNSMNCIGDKFNQTDSGGYLGTGTFNLWQTRPVWNSRAILDMVAYGFGYTPSYGSQVDTNTLEHQYISSKWVGDPNPREPEEITVLLDSSDPISPLSGHPASGFSFIMKYDTGALRPDDITGFINPFDDIADIYGAEYCIHPFNTTQGQVAFKFTVPEVGPGLYVSIQVFAIYYNATQTATIYDQINTSPPTDYNLKAPASTDGEVIIFFNKDTQLAPPLPAGAGQLLGFLIGARVTDTNYPDGGLTTGVQWVETEVLESYSETFGIEYDSNFQFYEGPLNLLKQSPKKSLLTIVSGLLKQQGLLIDIDPINKTVKYFNYQDIIVKKATKDWSDWSDYFIRVVKRDTNYGTNYGQVNKIALSSALEGNFYERSLLSTDSKYKQSGQFITKELQDLEKIETTVTTAGVYIASTAGLSLSGSSSSIGYSYFQTKADGSPETLGPALPYFRNINYQNIPAAIDKWFSIVEKNIREDIEFVLPTEIVRKIDLSKPVYIRQTASVYIINLIDEYQDNTESVIVQLIKI